MKKAVHLDAWLAGATHRLDLKHGALPFASAMERVNAHLMALRSSGGRGAFRAVFMGPDATSLESAWLHTALADDIGQPERMRRALSPFVAAHRLDEAARHLERACSPDGRLDDKERRAALRTVHNFMRFDAARTPTLVVIDASQLTGRRADALSLAFAALAESPVRVLLAAEGQLIDVLQPSPAPLLLVVPTPAGPAITPRKAVWAQKAPESEVDATAPQARLGRRVDDATRALQVAGEGVVLTSETDQNGPLSERLPPSSPLIPVIDDLDAAQNFNLNETQETQETRENSAVRTISSEGRDVWERVIWATGGLSWAGLIDSWAQRPGLSASLVASGVLKTRGEYLLVGEPAVALTQTSEPSPRHRTAPELHAAVAKFIEQGAPADALGWLTELERQWRWAGDDSRASAAAAAMASLLG